VGFDVLVLGYSQTGRTADALETFVGALRASPDVALTEVRIRPRTPFPYPWPLRDVWSVFPEVVCERPIALEPLGFDATRRYDLIVLGCQVWFLSCSLPICSLFQGDASHVFRDTPVVPVLTYRKAWSEGLAAVERHVARLGGRIAGRVVLRARDLVALAVLETGSRRARPAPEWRYDEGERARVADAGRRLAEALPRLGAVDGAARPELDSLPAAPARGEGGSAALVQRMIERYEGAWKRRYLRWGRFIERRSKPGTRLRHAWLLALAPLYLPPVYWTAPLTVLRRCLHR
jgi:hypothetical protein